MTGPRRHRDRRQTQKPSSANARAEERRNTDDRRTDARVPIDLWMEEVRGDEVYFRRSCNISEGGVFFDQSIPHPTGTLVTLRFALPGNAETLQVHGEVVSAARATDGLGMGVKFTTITAEVKKTLGEFIAKLAEKRGIA